MSPKPSPAGGAGVDELLDPTFLENAMRASMTEVRQLRRQAVHCFQGRLVLPLIAFNTPGAKQDRRPYSAGADYKIKESRDAIDCSGGVLGWQI